MPVRFGSAEAAEIVRNDRIARHLYRRAVRNGGRLAQAALTDTERPVMERLVAVGAWQAQTETADGAPAVTYRPAP